MKYMMLICRDPSIELSPEDLVYLPGSVRDWIEEMDSREIRLQGDQFKPASDARTVRIRGGQVQVADGPFADTREQVGGYNIINCADLEQAIEVATKHPMARLGAVEVRPFIPDFMDLARVDWDEFTGRLLEALQQCVRGDAERLKSLWSHRDDVTIFGGWGVYEQGWAAVERRLDWAASRYSEGWLSRENLLEGVDRDIAYSVDIEHGGWLDYAPEVREAPLRVTHLFRREEGRWRIVHRHADFFQPGQEPR